MLTELTIKRLRGITSLNVSGLASVNIFVGNNASGKTTVLEALLIAAIPNSPQHVPKLGHWRGVGFPTIENDEGISSLFHNGDFNHGPVVEFTIDGTKQSVLISPLKTTSAVNVPVVDTGGGASALSDDLRLKGLTYVFNTGVSGKDITSNLILTPAAPMVNSSMPYEGASGCYFVSARFANFVEDLANAVTRLSKKHQLEGFQTELSSIDNRIRAIKAGVRGKTPVVNIDIGLLEDISVNMLGDGFVRATAIVTGMANPSSKFVLIDEIDSGLHPSTMSKVWNSVFRMVESNKKQFFCATHSEEMLSKTLGAFKSRPEMLKIFRIHRRPDQTTVATGYTYDEFKISEESGTDIR